MKRILLFFKYEFRYILSSIYIILGMAVGFLALYNGVGVYQYIRAYTNDLRGNQYASTAKIQLGSLEPFSVQKYLYETVCVVRMDFVDVYINAEDVTCLLTVLFDTEEKPNYHLVEGRLPNAEEIAAHEPVVAVGRGRTDAVYYRNDVGYILLEGAEYRVTGIVGTKASDAQDHLLITYYNCLEEKVRENIEPGVYALVLESNIYDTEAEAKNIGSLASIDGINVTRTEAEINLSRMTREEKDSMTMYILLFGFTVLQSVMIAKFWIFQRKRDIAILRIAGFGKAQVLYKLIREMAFHILCACVLSGLIQGVIYLWVNNKMQYELSFYSVALVGVVIVLISVAIVISPALEVMKTPPVYEINGSGIQGRRKKLKQQ